MIIKNQPLVTIVIPNFNQSKFLRLALISVISQSYSNWEAIVVDNYSTDNSQEIVEQLSDNRIKLVKNHNNGVIAVSRNIGISLARGKFIAFLDSDDTWYSNKLERCLTEFKDEIGLISHGLRWVGTRQRDMYPGPQYRATLDQLIDHGNCITPSGTIVRKEHLVAVGGFSELTEHTTSEDYHLWMKLAKRGTKMLLINEILGEYRIHDGNHSASVERHLHSVISVTDDFLPLSEDRFVHSDMRRRRRHSLAFYGAGRTMQHKKLYQNSFTYLIIAIFKWPFDVRYYLALIAGIINFFIIKFQK